METRKIQQVGGGTFTVSLPLDWARAEAIDQGDIVDLHTHIDGVLVIQTRERETEPTGEISVELEGTDSDQIRRCLWAAYTAGYTEITLTKQNAAFTSSQRRVANEITNTLAGATLSSTAEQEIAIQVLLDPEEISVRQLVRQLSFIAISMQQQAMAVVSDERPKVDLADRQDQTDRLFAMIERSFTRALARLSEVNSLGETRSELFELWSTACELKRVAVRAEHINTIASGFDQPPDNDHLTTLQKLAGQAQDVVEIAVRGIVNDDGIETVEKAVKLLTDFRDKAEKLDRRSFEDTTADYRLSRLLDSVQWTAEHGGNIAERGLQRALRQSHAISLSKSSAYGRRPISAIPESSSDGN